jgi:quercetin dioxygenase-like cupin family protein
MRLFRLFTGDDQQSHLEELQMAFTSGQIAEQTSMQPAVGVIFTRMAPGTFVDWHNAPRRQYVITLAGGVEIGLGDGSLHRFGPGEGILAEDLTGKGLRPGQLAMDPG